MAARCLLTIGAFTNRSRMEMNLTKAVQHYGSIIELTLQKVKYSLRGRFPHSDEQQILARYARHDQRQ
ncbi:MAG TPA: hypothetical protein DCK93_05165 [Blastocatellia bacterium]|nr:hypothetical protein [Blastocatellia bacterium]HAF22293.1 hypothetical protein [Blastocatellia bacterium]